MRLWEGALIMGCEEDGSCFTCSKCEDYDKCGGSPDDWKCACTKGTIHPVCAICATLLWPLALV